MINNSDQVVLFDADCMLCNRFVQFVLRRDKGRYFFVSLTSQSGQRLLKEYSLPESSRKDVDTIYLISHNKVYQQSAAVLKIMAGCGMVWKALSLIGYLIPKFLRDYSYDFIAQRRKQINISCQLPNEENRHRIEM